MRGTTSRRRPRDEQGAVAVMMALLLPLVLLIGAFIVDLGLQRVARADARALADVVALDLAREVDGREISATTRPTWRR